MKIKIYFFIVLILLGYISNKPNDKSSEKEKKEEVDLFDGPGVSSWGLNRLDI